MRLQGSSDRRGLLVIAVFVVILAVVAYLYFFTTII